MVGMTSEGVIFILMDLVSFFKNEQIMDVINMECGGCEQEGVKVMNQAEREHGDESEHGGHDSSGRSGGLGGPEHGSGQQVGEGGTGPPHQDILHVKGSQRNEENVEEEWRFGKFIMN